MHFRQHNNGLNRPISIYEVHLGSWRRREGEQGDLVTNEEFGDFELELEWKVPAVWNAFSSSPSPTW